MFFHGQDMKKLHQYLDPEFLPENYGGKLPKIDYNGKEWYACVDKYVENIRLYHTYGYANVN